ncbi:MAG: hypothetical protein PHI27_00035 [Eubacteriales bacterium]|nr:hypothetical protein [Eubacteriales bacterium]MDD3880632.1 hypothetical protein [Eubacteriales bacterium]MDD4513538.1 hypothetical protein [Eubacteriales bacterium]
MNKKLSVIALVLALMMCMTATAFAVPSKTVQDTTDVEPATTEDGTPIEEPIVTKSEDTALADEALTTIIADIGEGKTVADIFGGTVTADMQLNEVAQLHVADTAVVDDIGNIKVTIVFATQYAPDATVAVFAGLKTGDAVEWNELPASVNEDGSVSVTYTADFLAKAKGQDFILAVLNK